MTGRYTVPFGFITLFCQYGHRRLAHGGSPFAPALVSTSLEMTGLRSVPLGFIMIFFKYGHRRLAHRGSLSAGRGRPALPRRCYARQSIVALKRYTLRRTRNAPTCLYNHCGYPPLPRFNKRYVISPSVATRQLPRQRAPSIRLLFSVVCRIPLCHNLFRPLKRCGVWDTVASVPAAFLLLFSPLEKSKIQFLFF